MTLSKARRSCLWHTGEAAKHISGYSWKQPPCLMCREVVMTNKASFLQPGEWIWFRLFMIQFQLIDNYWMAIKNTLSVSIQLLTELWNTHKTTTNGDCALLWGAETQKWKCLPPPCISSSSYNTGTKVEPHQEVVVWEVCITITVTIFLSLALWR